MFTDYHSHILPEIDDGSKSAEESVQMLEKLSEQGLERVVATPHFYAHREESVESFIKKRKSAYEKLCRKNIPVKEIYLGAEILMESGISECDGIEKLAIEGTNLILLEPPYYDCPKNLTDEIYSISYDYKLKPVIAHIHRYIGLYEKSEIEELLKIDAVFQINNQAFRNFREKHFVKSLIKEGYPLVFGSDCHNMTSRIPDFDVILKKGKLKESIERSDKIFEEYRK